jgi:S-formylglutathione hydrolase
MGGHGALLLHLKHLNTTYRSVSALSPIVAPMQVPRGVKAFTAYLGDERNSWADYDASMLVGKQPSQGQILIDTGDADAFREEPLRPSLFIDACQQAGQTLNNRMQLGYDHSSRNTVGAVLSRKLQISHAPEARLGKKLIGNSK